MAIRSIHNEKEIIEQVATGDQRAFTKLFDAYYKQLGEYIYKLTESIEVTEEIVQDVFIKIWSGRERLTEINNLSYYLFILSRNQTYNHLRRKATERVQYLEWEKQFEEETFSIDQISPEEKYRLLIDNAIDKLPPQQKKVYQLSRYERLKYDEIAQVLNLSSETVKKHMQLALRFIKEYVRSEVDAVIILILLTPLVFK